MIEENLKYIERLRNMSVKAFEIEKKSPRYIELIQNKDSEVKKACQSMFTGRMSDMKKREKILELMYTSPDLLFETIQKIQTYRTAKYKHKIKMAAFHEMDKDKYVIQEMQQFDHERRNAHNEALSSFCRLVLATSPGSNKKNTEFDENGINYAVRTEENGDLYTGELMNPLGKGVQELPSLIRASMTDGMIKGFLCFLERTYSGDWEKSRSKVLDRLVALGKLSEQDKELIERRGKSVEIDHVEQDDEDAPKNVSDSTGISSGRRAIQMFHQQWHGHGEIAEYQKERYIYGIERLEDTKPKKRSDEDIDI